MKGEVWSSSINLVESLCGMEKSLPKPALPKELHNGCNGPLVRRVGLRALSAGQAKLQHGSLAADAEGFEHPHSNTGNPRVRSESGAESGAVGTPNDALDPDLVVRLFEAWPTLATDARRRVLEIFAEDSPREMEGTIIV